MLILAVGVALLQDQPRCLEPEPGAVVHTQLCLVGLADQEGSLVVHKRLAHTGDQAVDKTQIDLRLLRTTIVQTQPLLLRTADLLHSRRALLCFACHKPPGRTSDAQDELGPATDSIHDGLLLGLKRSLGENLDAHVRGVLGTAACSCVIGIAGLIATTQEFFVPRSEIRSVLGSYGIARFGAFAQMQARLSSRLPSQYTSLPS
ncbi:hypothetical protein ON010_g8446 [Phytophthora cinnamomi]|nr:hypothetical protein ON010_g8446 [Phytophthora cinnamomi]